ncbi:PhaM family polyhydroxyalkanoate granule multifunctional regulatory protein [Undibacterium sp. SXout7W]|uniref:PhaM family polyhydroxyalkanoate granule multifunctional regulatory protein n=1 Tax=Undibacterium sp. SXout7W TaxID=3413049 RepID=UPI003BF0B2E1
MNNPFASSDIPGMSAMGDTLSFVKNLWGNMQVPGMVAPPMSIDELDKKIQDLKTVESWLNVNMNMLRGTIQALEVQRATIATLKSLGESFAQHVQQASSVSESNASPFSSASTASGSFPFASNSDWPMPSGSTKASAPTQNIAEPEPVIEPVVEPEPAAEKPQATTAKAETETPFANPTMWWGLLQDQFKQAVSKAMESDMLPKMPPMPGSTNTDTPAAPVAPVTPATSAKPRRPAARKPAAKSPSASTKSTGKSVTKSMAKATTKSAAVTQNNADKTSKPVPVKKPAAKNT